MPAVQSRLVTNALRIALGALLFPTALAVIDVVRYRRRAALDPPRRTWYRDHGRGSRGRPPALLEQRLRAQSRMDEELRASEAKFSGIPQHRRGRDHHDRRVASDPPLQSRRRGDLRLLGERGIGPAALRPAPRSIPRDARRAHQRLRANRRSRPVAWGSTRDAGSGRTAPSFRPRRRSRSSSSLAGRASSPSCCATSRSGSAPRMPSDFSRTRGRSSLGRSRRGTYWPRSATR